jgi:GNAT superfamily N-acetyltransferase
MDILIRPAKKEDCQRMMELIHELAVYEKAPEQVVVPFDHFVESGFGKQPVWWALVAEVKGVVVGMALYYVRYSTWKGQRMYLEDLIVSEDMRGNQIGSLLFDALIKEAKAKNFVGMNWQALDWNEPALNFYRKYNASFDPEWVNCAIDF